MRLARAIRNNIPAEVFSVIIDDEWKGGPLICLDERAGRPTAHELAVNSSWLHPICEFSPKKAREPRLFSQKLFNMQEKGRHKD